MPYLSALILIAVLLPSFSFSQAQDRVGLPEDLEDVQKLGEKALEIGKKELPGTIERIWQEEVLPIWQKMYDIWSNFWDKTFGPWLDSIWQKIKGVLGQEIEKRKPLIEEEFQKEKEEMKQEVPKVSKSLWEKFKELIK